MYRRMGHKQGAKDEVFTCIAFYVMQTCFFSKTNELHHDTKCALYCNNDEKWPDEPLGDFELLKSGTSKEAH